MGKNIEYGIQVNRDGVWNNVTVMSAVGKDNWPIETFDEAKGIIERIRLRFPMMEYRIVCRMVSEWCECFMPKKG